MGRPRERKMTNAEYKEVKVAVKALKQKVINDELILRVAEYKIYYMLSNAEYRTKTRNEYKGVEYKLGEYKNGLKSMRKYRPDLYGRYWIMIRDFIEHEFDFSFAPTIHRTNKHYEWETIDILTAKEHKDLDNAKQVIIRNQVKIGKSRKSTESKGKLLTMEDIKKSVEGNRYPSITKAIEYLQNEYGLKSSEVRRVIDTGEIIQTEKGNFEILKAESKEKVSKLKSNRNREIRFKRFPEFKKAQETMEKLDKYGILKNLDNFERIALFYKFAKAAREAKRKYKLIRGYRNLMIQKELVV